LPLATALTQLHAEDAVWLSQKKNNKMKKMRKRPQT